MPVLCPCDWLEKDEGQKYTVEVYGRTDELEQACVKIYGYKPYFYVAREMELAKFKNILLEQEIKVSITEEEKYDVYGGYQFYKKTPVWKLEVESLKDYRNLVNCAKTNFQRVYEANLPPLLRFYHDHNIPPASPVKFTSSTRLSDTKGWRVYHADIVSCPSTDVPLKIAKI